MLVALRIDGIARLSRNSPRYSPSSIRPIPATKLLLERESGIFFNRLSSYADIRITRPSSGRFVGDAAASEGDLLTGAARHQLLVDELATVVGVDAEQCEGEHAARPLQCLHDPVLGAVQA